MVNENLSLEYEDKKIKDLVMSLNTQNGLQARVVTGLINGKLCAFILSAPKGVHVLIRLKESGIVLFEKIDYVGINYLPVKCDSYSNNMELFNYGADNFYLNDELEIIIKGGPQSQLGVKVRYYG